MKDALDSYISDKPFRGLSEKQYKDGLARSKYDGKEYYTESGYWSNNIAQAVKFAYERAADHNSEPLVLLKPTDDRFCFRTKDIKKFNLNKKEGIDNLVKTYTVLAEKNKNLLNGCENLKGAVEFLKYAINESKKLYQERKS